MTKPNIMHCTKCDTTLWSQHRHDWKACKCGNYVDGGNSYGRHGGNFEDILVLEESGFRKLSDIIAEAREQRGW